MTCVATLPKSRLWNAFRKLSVKCDHRVDLAPEPCSFGLLQPTWRHIHTNYELVAR